MTQLDMRLSGIARRDSGIAQAVDHAERESPEWGDRALDMLRRYVREVGGRFQAEDVREFGKTHGLDNPPHKRAWGGVMVRAKNLGLIKCIGTQQVENSQAHCANAGLWEAIYDEK